MLLVPTTLPYGCSMQSASESSESSARLAACVTFAPLQVTCAKLEALCGEPVVGQVMVVPDDRELHDWAIGSVASVSLINSMEIMLADLLEHLAVESHLKSTEVWDDLRKILNQYHDIFNLPGDALG